MGTTTVPTMGHSHPAFREDTSGGGDGFPRRAKGVQDPNAPPIDVSGFFIWPPFCSLRGNAHHFGGGRSSFLTHWRRCGSMMSLHRTFHPLYTILFWEALVASVAGAFQRLCARAPGW